MLAGCSRPVAVPPASPAPSGTDAARCDALAAALPATVQGQARRDVQPASSTTASWGDPPIVLRCGVPHPPGLTPTVEVIDVEGVRWYAEQLGAGYRFTTSGRTPYLEVTVPDAYRPEVDPLVDLGGAVRAALPATAPSSSP